MDEKQVETPSVNAIEEIKKIENSLKVATEEVITLTKQSDGNWVGKATKYGKPIEVRDVGPETVLQKLLTHD